MDDLKLFEKNEDRINSLIKTVRLFSKGINHGIWITKV